jgi:hypothetical protein
MKQHTIFGYAASLGLSTLIACNQTQVNDKFRADTEDFYRVTDMRPNQAFLGEDISCTVNVNYVSFVTSSHGNWVTEPSFETYNFRWEVDGVSVLEENGLESKLPGEYVTGLVTCIATGPIFGEEK